MGLKVYRKNGREWIARNGRENVQDGKRHGANTEFERGGAEFTKDHPSNSVFARFFIFLEAIDRRLRKCIRIN